MLVGAATESASGSDFASQAAAAGPWTVRRSYNTAIPASWAASTAGVDVGQRASIWSCKPDLTQLASGALDATIRTFVASIPATHVCWLTAWHEPGHKIRGGTFTLSAYLAGFRRWSTVVKQAITDYGKPHVYTTQIVQTWDGIHPTPGTTLEEMWPGDGMVDCLGIDAYSNEGTGDALWGPALAHATRHGIPWIAPEVGCGTVMDTSWMSAAATYAATHAAGGQHTRCGAFCWFSNSTGPTIATPGSNSAAIAVAKSVSQTYYTDFNAFVL